LSLGDASIIMEDEPPWAIAGLSTTCQTPFLPGIDSGASEGRKCIVGEWLLRDRKYRGRDGDRGRFGRPQNRYNRALGALSRVRSHR
jgi:hypothetical protein